MRPLQDQHCIEVGRVPMVVEVLPVVSPEAGILLNDSPAAWAWLEDGDRLQIGERVLLFESLPPAHLRPA